MTSSLAKGLSEGSLACPRSPFKRPLDGPRLTPTFADLHSLTLLEAS